MASSTPGRKFKVEPMETTTKSSRKFVPQPFETTTSSSRKAEEHSSASPPRNKTLPQPIETIKSSSCKAAEESAEPNSRIKALPQPIETTTSDYQKSAEESTSSIPKKRVLPQPIQTSISSSRKAADASSTSAPKKRILPQPIETSSSSSKMKQIANSKTEPRKFTPQLLETTTKSKPESTTTASKTQRFTPQLIETTTEKRRNAPSSLNINNSQATNVTAEEAKPRVRFAPQLIDTAKRTRKAGDIRPAHLPSDRTDAMPADIDITGRFRSGIVPPPSSARTCSPVMSSAEARRLGIPLPKRQYTDSSLRQHSFHVPDLETIESSESDDTSDELSSPSSPSSNFSHATRIRESIDASSSGYLLELAAKAAEKQLREQALDAFPNDDRHTQVDHWIDRDSDMDTSMSSRSELDHRRFGSVNWDLKDLRKRHEEIESQMEKEQNQKEARRKQRNHLRQQNDDTAWSNPFLKHLAAPAGWKKGAEMEKMRKTARPPMLGGDIKFPRCQSPDAARFDVTQGSSYLRTAMCYLTEQTDVEECKEGLWSPKESTNTGCPSLTIWSRPTSRAPSPGGLWGGCCTGANLTPPRGPTGLMTPFVDEDAPNPLDSVTTMRQLPPSPPISNSGMANLDEKLEIEHSIEAEFDDTFVTQVYNYLSLGYPSLAQRFDGELSKISRVPVSELRLDDNLASARGYIRLGEDECGKEDGINEEMCARWKALRLYIHEWGRQQSRMISPQNHHQAGFGVLARRGSWAW